MCIWRASAPWSELGEGELQYHERLSAGTFVKDEIRKLDCQLCTPRAERRQLEQPRSKLEGISIEEILPCKDNRVYLYTGPVCEGNFHA